MAVHDNMALVYSSPPGAERNSTVQWCTLVLSLVQGEILQWCTPLLLVQFTLVYSSAGASARASVLFCWCWCLYMCTHVLVVHSTLVYSSAGASASVFLFWCWWCTRQLQPPLRPVCGAVELSALLQCEPELFISSSPSS